MKRIPDIFFKLSDNKESSELVNLIESVTATSTSTTTLNKKGVSVENGEDDEEYDIVEEEDDDE